MHDQVIVAGAVGQRSRFQLADDVDLVVAREDHLALLWVLPAPRVPFVLDIDEALNDINPDFPFTLEKAEPRRQPEEPRGTDSGPFAVAGVPIMTFGTADPKGYNFDYREIWHTERDLYNKSIPEYQEHTAIVTAVVVYGVANLDHLLSREGYWMEEEEGKDLP